MVKQNYIVNLLFITSLDPLANRTKKNTLKITDGNGKEILREKMANSYTLTTKLEAGIYFYSITNIKNSVKGTLIIN